MSRTSVQLALREVQAVYRQPRALLVMAIVGALAGFTGPLGTFSALSTGARFGYWVAVAFTSYGVGLFGATLAGAWFSARSLPRALVVLAVAVGAALPVTALVFALNAAFYPAAGRLEQELPRLFVYCLGISLAVVALSEALSHPPADQDASQAPPTSADPPLLARLPHHVRAPLTHLSMADHYVEVHTQKGRALVLMRFADAVRETDGVDGLQVHRSHWVARGAVHRIARIDGRPVVELEDGTTLPVSRTHLARVRALFGPL